MIPGITIYYAKIAHESHISSVNGHLIAVRRPAIWCAGIDHTNWDTCAQIRYFSCLNFFICKYNVNSYHTGQQRRIQLLGGFELKKLLFDMLGQHFEKNR